MRSHCEHSYYIHIPSLLPPRYQRHDRLTKAYSARFENGTTIPLANIRENAAYAALVAHLIPNTTLALLRRRSPPLAQPVPGLQEKPWLCPDQRERRSSRDACCAQDGFRNGIADPDRGDRGERSVGWLLWITSCQLIVSTTTPFHLWALGRGAVGGMVQRTTFVSLISCW